LKKRLEQYEPTTPGAGPIPAGEEIVSGSEAEE
jgi:hypothetical protein